MDSPDNPKPPEAQLGKTDRNPKLMSRRKFFAHVGALAGLIGVGAVFPQVRPQFTPRSEKTEENPPGIPYAGRPPGEIFYNPSSLPQERLFNFPISNPLDVIFIENIKPGYKQAIIRKIELILHPPITTRSIFKSIAQLYDNPFESARKLEYTVRKVLDESGKFNRLPEKDKDIFIKLVQAVALIESKAKHEIKEEEEEQKVLGIMQIEQTTAQELNSDHGINADPKTEAGNLLLGALYLRWMIQAAQGDVIKACAMYNLGIGTISQAEQDFELKHKRKSANYEELISDSDIVRYILDKNDHISSKDELNDIYRYPAAYIRLFCEKEFEQIKNKINLPQTKP